MIKHLLMGVVLTSTVLAGAPTAALAHEHGWYHGDDDDDGPGWRGRGYYYDRPYYHREYRHHRCGDGTAGLIIGGAAGALIGREIGRNSGRHYGRHGYYRTRHGDGTTGAIIGGAAGALIGHSIASEC